MLCGKNSYFGAVLGTVGIFRFLEVALTLAF
jgi:hypothetical protein